MKARSKGVLSSELLSVTWKLCPITEMMEMNVGATPPPPASPVSKDRSGDPVLWPPQRPLGTGSWLLLSGQRKALLAQQHIPFPPMQGRLHPLETTVPAPRHCGVRDGLLRQVGSTAWAAPNSGISQGRGMEKLQKAWLSRDISPNHPTKVPVPFLWVKGQTYWRLL